MKDKFTPWLLVWTWNFGTSRSPCLWVSPRHQCSLAPGPGCPQLCCPSVLQHTNTFSFILGCAWTAEIRPWFWAHSSLWVIYSWDAEFGVMVEEDSALQIFPGKKLWNVQISSLSSGPSAVFYDLSNNRVYVNMFSIIKLNAAILLLRNLCSYSFSFLVCHQYVEI